MLCSGAAASLEKRPVPVKTRHLVAKVDECSKLHKLCQAVHNVQQLHNLQEVEGGQGQNTQRRQDDADLQSRNLGQEATTWNMHRMRP